jgi:hypothetical protein
VWHTSDGASGISGLSAGTSVKVTCFSADGKLENVRAPYYGTPPSKTFWKPVFDGIRERLTKRGWQNTEVLLGLPWDGEPQEEVVAFFKEITPEWRWRIHTHGYGKPLPNAEGKLVLGCGLEVGWLEGIGPAEELGGKWPNMAKGALMKRTYPITCGTRGVYHPQNPHIAWWRDEPILDTGKCQGTSQIGLDFWNGTLHDGGGGNPRDGLRAEIVTPGPNGAETSLYYEMLREGLQTTAAFCSVRDHNPELPAELKAKAKRAAEDMEIFIRGRFAWPDPIATSQRRWNAAVRDLYRIAGEVQAITPKN